MITPGTDLKKYRSEGKIPGVYYSYESKASTPFLVSQSEINKAIKSDANIFAISVGGENRNVLFKWFRDTNLKLYNRQIKLLLILI